MSTSQSQEQKIGLVVGPGPLEVQFAATIENRFVALGEHSPGGRPAPKLQLLSAEYRKDQRKDTHEK